MWWQDDFLFPPVFCIANSPWGMGMDGADHDTKGLLGITLDKVFNPSPVVGFGLCLGCLTTDPVNLFKRVYFPGRDMLLPSQTNAIPEVIELMHHAFCIRVRGFVIAKRAISLRHQPGIEFCPSRCAHRFRHKHILKSDAARCQLVYVWGRVRIG